jgi:uncharacterized membrane protein (DUF4010 family)
VEYNQESMNVQVSPSELDAAARLAIAALIGLGVGLEREWSGHASGPAAHFAGIRTFMLLGLLGGAAGLLFVQSFGVGAAALILTGGGLTVAAYVMAVRRPEADLDGTTEAAALIVIALGVLAGIGWIVLAAGTGTLVVLALSEKTRLHWFVRRVDERELRAALQFAVLAFVVMPLLPAGPLWGDLAVRPRALWAVVLIFSGLDFIGYLARHAVGPERGFKITGALGGIVSSTLVTLGFSRQSRREPSQGTSLGFGVVAACTVLLPRVAVLSAALSRPIARALIPFLLLPLAVGVGVSLLGRRSETAASGGGVKATGNPLRLATAIRMTVFFQVGITLMAYVYKTAGDMGVYATGTLLGVADIDALTVSMTNASAGLTPALAARVIAVGILANTLLKLGISIALGAPSYRKVTVPSLAALALATAAGIWLL